MVLSENTQQLQNYFLTHSDFSSISEKEIAEKYQELIDCLVDHNHLYYIENDPILSDKEYDELFDYLKKIEEYFPHLISGNSPTQGLIGQIAEGFTQASHTTKLLSLENTYNAEDLESREERVEKILIKQKIDYHNITYTIEPKFDGLSVELIYKKGIFIQAITRGDGRVGEDITINTKTIRNIPQKLKDPIDISIRGEILMPKSIREKINKEREENGDMPFANTRNAAAGSIKLLDSKEVGKRGLVCYVYDILTCSEEIIHLENLGLPIYPWKKTVHSMEEIIDVCKDTDTKEELISQDIDFDGLVIKVFGTAVREYIGATEHHPRRAVAYKFPAQQVATQVQSIDFQIGRTGIITPVANLSPVQLSGATISRTTLHNFDFVHTKDIRVGDWVWLQRSGEVIPYIVGVIKDKRSGTETTLEAPQKCPVCESQVVHEDMHYYCSNETCPGQIKTKLEHFVSKNCMDIQGIGESMIDILVDQKILQNIADIFTLGDPQIQMTLQRLPGFGNKKVSEIAIQLLQAKEKPLRRLLNGLGIGHVGKKTAIILNDNLINYYSLQDETLSPLENLIKHITDETFLQAIFGIGEKTLQEIQEFFTKKNNKELLERLSVFGINFDPIKWYKDKENLGIFEELNQGSFCITGSFPVSRENIVETMQTHGRTFHEQPKKDTQLMLIGDKPGSKKAKAEELGCEIIQSRETILLRFPFLQDITPEETKKISTNMPISQSLF